MIKTVLGLGTAAMDIVIQCDSLPRADAFEIIKNEKILSGGSCANMLVTLARLGVNARQVAKIGDDDLGRIFRADLVEAGVDDSLLITIPNGQTMHTYIFATGNGDHTIFANMGDCIMNLSSAEISPAMLEGVDLFYTDMFPAQPALTLARLCVQKGIPVVLGLECPLEIMHKIGVREEEIREMLALADLFISTRDGYFSLTHNSDHEQALEQLYKKYPTRLGMICTAGEKEVIWIDKTETITARPYEVIPVDTTGSGDCFLGGLIYSYLAQGADKRQAIQFALATAAIKCTQAGPRIKADLTMINEFIASF